MSTPEKTQVPNLLESIRNIEGKISTWEVMKKKVEDLSDQELEEVELFNTHKVKKACAALKNAIEEYTFYKPEKRDSYYIHFRPKNVRIRKESQCVKKLEFMNAFPQGYFRFVDLTKALVQISRKHLVEIDDIGSSAAYGVETDFSTTNYIISSGSGKKINLFAGFPFDPLPGNVNPFLIFVVRILCSGNIDAANFFLDWVAQFIQYPGDIHAKAIVLHSYDEGPGKNTLAQIMMNLISLDYVAPVDPSMFSGTHNGSLEGKLVAVADEAFASSHSARDKLKSWIGNRTVAIRSMQKDTRQVTNFCRFLILSNNDNMVSFDQSNRRYVVFAMSLNDPDSKNIMDRLYAWMDSPGAMSHLMAYFVGRKIKTSFHGPGVPVFFPDLVDTILNTSRSYSDPIKVWIKASKGSLGNSELALPTGKVAYKVLFEKYVEYANKNMIRAVDIEIFKDRIKREKEFTDHNKSVWNPHEKKTQKGCTVTYDIEIDAPEAAE